MASDGSSGTGVAANGPQISASQLPILIIGSGSTGLALAQGLRKAGINCIVFEKNPTLHGHRDWNMGLHWGAPALKSLMPDGWWDNIQSLQVDPHVPTNPQDTLKLINGATSELMSGITFGPFYRLRRSKLRELLVQNLDIRFGKQLSNITYASDNSSVTAHFTDGTSTTGLMLIGADGSRSTTRTLLLGPENGAIRRLPYAVTFMQMRYPRDQALHLRSFHPLYLGSPHPANKFAFFGMQDAADAADPSTWTFFFYISWPSSLEEQDATAHWTEAQRIRQQKELARDYVDPWKSAIEAVPEDHTAWYLGFTDWDPEAEGHRWDNHGGLVTLVGDACHTMTTQRGQGLNHALTDAGHLRDAIVAVLREGDRERRAKVVAEFEDEMIERTGKEVRTSTLNTGMLHDWEKVMASPVMTSGLNKGGAVKD